MPRFPVSLRFLHISLLLAFCSTRCPVTLTLPLGQQGPEEQGAEEEEEEEEEDEEEELQVVQVSEKEFNFLDYLKRCGQED